MAGIAGCCNFDGQTPDPETLGILVEGLRKRGVDGVDWRRDSAVVMVHGAFHTNRLSRKVQQPLQGHGILLNWDGRLDNRDELTRTLGVSNQLSDAELALEAFRRRGRDFVSLLIGDFAVSLWDGTRRALLLARDFAGTRPLYYHLDRDRVLWSSSLRSLLAFSDIPKDIDEEYLVGYLVREPEPVSTPYKAIRSAPPGGCIEIERGNFKQWKFWGPDPERQIRCASDAEYEDRFLALFREAVASRLRVEGPAVAELSGGLDSSAIVCMAHELIRDGAVEASGLETISYVFDESRQSDERPFIQEVESRIGHRGIYLREDDHPVLSGLEDGFDYPYPSPTSCFAGRFRDITRTVEQIGARVILDGLGGDGVTWAEPGWPFVLADLASRFRFSDLFRELRAWSESMRYPYLDLIREAVIRPFAPSRWRIGGMNYPMLPKWLNQAYMQEHGLEEKLVGTPLPRGFLPSQREQWLPLLDEVGTLAVNYFFEHSVPEKSHPFMHRPFLEFCLALPGDQKLRPGQNRSVMRRALKDLLPEKIVNRTTKDGPDEALLKALTRERKLLDELFSNRSRTAALGLIEPAAFDDALEAARHGINPHLPMLLRIISIELWLRWVDDMPRRVSMAEAPEAAA